MLGKFTVKSSNYYISDGVDKEADVTTAKQRFREYIVDVNSEGSEHRKDGNMTIRFYLESGRYQQDRRKYSIKNGKFKEVANATIKGILSGFKPWLDFKLNEVNEAWALEFDEYASKPRTNKANGVQIEGLSSDSKRKQFSAFNAMFNICEKAGYIRKNRLEGQIARFPKAKPGKTNTYDISYDDLMEHIFDDETPGDLSGKVFVAGMAVTACRNGELYKNVIQNFDFEKRSIFIPAKICKTNAAGERTVYPDSDIFWEKLELHSRSIIRNKHNHMFPSPTMPEQHISSSVYKATWQSVKVRFNLKKTDRLYDLRATLLTKIAETHGIDVAAAAAGDSIETADKYYNNKSEDRLRNAYSDNTSSKKSLPRQKPVVGNNNAIVLASIELMPQPVAQLFNMFRNGKDIPKENHLYKSDWDKFIKIISAQHEAGKLSDPLLPVWLAMQ